MLKYLFSFLRRKPKNQILCVHGKTPFLRNTVAAMLFLEHVDAHGSGDIVCSPKAVVGILESLGVDTPDGMKWWNSKRKWEFAQSALSNHFCNISLLPSASEHSVVWIDGARLAEGYTPKNIVVFTGSINEDPFYQLERTTCIPSADGGQSYITRPGEYCSSWHA